MNELPATFSVALLSEPAWLLAWLALLIGTHFLSLIFTVYREQSAFRYRWEPIAIVVSFMIAGSIMEVLYQSVGYVRLLGIGHIIGWTPMYAWLLYHRKQIGFESMWGKYVHLYLVLAGISLVIDSVDVVRYLVGDNGSLYLRWAG